MIKDRIRSLILLEKLREHLHIHLPFYLEIYRNERKAYRWNISFEAETRSRGKIFSNVSSVDETKETVVSNRWTKRSIKLHQVGRQNKS